MNMKSRRFNRQTFFMPRKPFVTNTRRRFCKTPQKMSLKSFGGTRFTTSSVCTVKSCPRPTKPLPCNTVSNNGIQNLLALPRTCIWNCCKNFVCKQNHEAKQNNKRCCTWVIFRASERGGDSAHMCECVWWCVCGDARERKCMRERARGGSHLLLRDFARVE